MEESMRKYIFIFKATLIESLQYVMNILLAFVTFFMILFVFINLWQYMYSDSGNLISGYSIQQMIWYVILTEIMWFGGRNGTLTSQISNDIKSGTIAYGMNKPYHYILYIIAKHLGEITIKFFLFLGAGLVIGYAFLGDFPDFKLYQLPFVMISFFMGIMINSFLRMGISVLSFWIEDAVPFHWIYDKLIIVVGTMFPVEMFPAWAQPMIKCSPIFVVNYGPAKMVIDFSFDMALQVLFVQVIYFAVTLLVLFALYQRGVKRLNVNGG
jgi:ABC-2 type transport system permease protein